MRRGFTLVETLLATTLAGVVVVGALGVLGALQRADASLARRFDSASELTSLHKAFTAAFQEIVVSPNDASANQSQTTTAGTRDADAVGEARGSARTGTTTERPRVILGMDEGALVGSRGVFDLATWEESRPQSLEIVLENPPGGYAFPRRFTTDDIASLNLTGGGVRGVFELRPDPDDGRAWVLWWRPVREDGSAWSADYEVNREANALRLAGGLTLFRVRVFDNRERKTLYEATGQKELPAYIEIELRTVSGLYANWMFEIDWKVGDEQHVATEEELASNEADEETDGEGAGGPTDRPGGGPGGGPGRPGRDAARPGERTPPARQPGTRPQTPGAPSERPSGGGGR